MSSGNAICSWNLASSLSGWCGRGEPVRAVSCRPRQGPIGHAPRACLGALHRRTFRREEAPGAIRDWVRLFGRQSHRVERRGRARDCDGVGIRRRNASGYSGNPEAGKLGGASALVVSRRRPPRAYSRPRSQSAARCGGIAWRGPIGCERPALLRLPPDRGRGRRALPGVSWRRSRAPRQARPGEHHTRPRRRLVCPLPSISGWRLRLPCSGNRGPPQHSLRARRVPREQMLSKEPGFHLRELSRPARRSLEARCGRGVQGMSCRIERQMPAHTAVRQLSHEGQLTDARSQIRRSSDSRLLRSEVEFHRHLDESRVADRVDGPESVPSATAAPRCGQIGERASSRIELCGAV